MWLQVDAFQFTALHGEVCPVNWKPGTDAMKADPYEKLAYFERKQEIELAEKESAEEEAEEKSN